MAMIFVVLTQVLKKFKQLNRIKPHHHTIVSPVEKNVPKHPGGHFGIKKIELEQRKMLKIPTDLGEL